MSGNMEVVIPVNGDISYECPPIAVELSQFRPVVEAKGLPEEEEDDELDPGPVEVDGQALLSEGPASEIWFGSTSPKELASKPIESKKPGEPVLDEISPEVAGSVPSNSFILSSSIASFSFSFCVRLFCLLSSYSHSSALFILRHGEQTGFWPSHF